MDGSHRGVIIRRHRSHEVIRKKTSCFSGRQDVVKKNDMGSDTIRYKLDVNRNTKLKTREEVNADERNAIKQWRERRLNKTSSIYSELALYSCSVDTIKSFLQNINFMVVFQMCISALAVFICQQFKIQLDIPVALYVSPIVFPLAFAINTDFQRREKVLEDLALFKSSGMVWYFCMREWKEAAGLDYMWIKSVHDIILSLLFHLCEYLITSKQEHRLVILRAIYEDFSSVNKLVEKLRDSSLPQNTAIISRSVHLLHSMSLAFERLRVVREYRSPRAIRSFNKVFIMLLPIILAPYFVYKREKWEAYYMAIPVAFVFSALQSVQDKLDDPFDGMGEDDINLDTVDTWVFGSVEQTVGKSFKVGRFNVNIDPKNSLVEPSPCLGCLSEEKSEINRWKFFGKGKEKQDEIKMKKLDTKIVTMVTKIEENKQIREFSFGETFDQCPARDVNATSRSERTHHDMKNIDNVTAEERNNNNEYFKENNKQKGDVNKIEKHNSTESNNYLFLPTNENHNFEFKKKSPLIGRSDSCIPSLRVSKQNVIDIHLPRSHHDISTRNRRDDFRFQDKRLVEERKDLNRKDVHSFLSGEIKQSRANSYTIGDVHDNSFDTDDLNDQIDVSDSSFLLNNKESKSNISGSRTSIKNVPVDNIMSYHINDGIQTSILDEKVNSPLFTNKLLSSTYTALSDDDTFKLKKTRNGILKIFGNIRNKSNSSYVTTKEFVSSINIPPV